MSISPITQLSLAKMANIAAFAASDSASALTGTVLNLSRGALADQLIIAPINTGEFDER